MKQIFAQEKYITVVSGLPRSGTSMMMAALKAGGMPLVTDNLRTSDENNPKGYYEFERVKKLPKGDKAWLESSLGKAVKIISVLLEYLPKKYSYRVIFMERDIDEILNSQQRMLERTGKKVASSVEDEIMRKSYEEHLTGKKNWLEKKSNFRTLYLSYNDVLQDPMIEFDRVSGFLDHCLDVASMTKVVDTNLYRERTTE
jgi:hypothetical protein